jgi:hypothetical protein
MKLKPKTKTAILRECGRFKSAVTHTTHTLFETIHRVLFNLLINSIPYLCLTQPYLSIKSTSDSFYIKFTSTSLQIHINLILSSYIRYDKMKLI